MSDMQDTTLERVGKILSYILVLDDSTTYNLDTTFKELGCDSLDMAQITVAVDVEFNTDLDIEVKYPETVGELVEMIEKDVSQYP